MIDQQELRVGICSCSSVFSGLIEGQAVQVIETPFILSEVYIDQKQQHDDMRRNRAHLFLDVHPTREGTRTTVSLIDLRAATGRRDSVYIGLPLKNRNTSRNLAIEEWFPELPSVEELLEGTRNFLSLMAVDRSRFDLWLARMTPPGWVLPKQTLSTGSLCSIFEQTQTSL